VFDLQDGVQNGCVVTAIVETADLRQTAAANMLRKIGGR
jgi:hypothetical protein